MADAALIGLDLFAGCTDAERERAGRLLEARRFAAGEIIIEAGEGDRRLLIVVDGRVRVVTSQGVEGLLGPGDIVGEMALMDDVVHSATVVAEVDTDVLVADVVAFERLRHIGDVGRRLRAVSDARRAVAGTSIVEASTVTIFVRPPRVMGRGAGLVARSDRKHRPVRLAVLGVLALTVVAGAAFLVVGNSSTPVALDDVMARFAAGGPAAPSAPAPADQAAPPDTTDGGDPVAVDGALGAPLAVTAPSVAEPVGSPTAPTSPPPPQTPTPAGSTPPAAPTAPQPPTGTASAPPRAYLLPEPGVYSYATTGGESISVPNGDHRYPAETYGAVRLTGGCGWSVEHWVLEEHSESHERCSERGRVLAIADGRYVSFFGKGSDTTYRCDPPAVLLRDDVEVGFKGSSTCTASNGDTATYRGTLVAIEDRVVGGQPVRTQRVHLDVEITGSARGTSTVEMWLDARTGLLVREERSTRADVDSELGPVRYTEDATFELLSMTPRR